MILPILTPTETPASWRPLTARDWRKIPLVLSGRWPKPVPPRISVTGDHAPFLRWAEEATQAPYICMDTERDRLLALGTPGGDGCVVFWTQLTPGQRLDVCEVLYALCAIRPVLFHNAPCDMTQLEAWVGLTIPFHYVNDTLIAHAVTHPGYPHSLTFCQSVYGQYPYVKKAKEPGLHPWGDVLATIDTWESLRREMTDVHWDAYERHRTRTLPAVVASWRAGREVNIGTAVDATWTEKRTRGRVSGDKCHGEDG